MNNHATIPIAQRALSRPGYAIRVTGCFAGLFGFGMVLGLVFQSKMISDPMGALGQIYGLIILANVVMGGFFVLFTHRRALDCTFGKNGRPGIATVAALPTLILPQYGLLVFAVMMFIKSAPQGGETSEIENDSGVLRPLQAGE